MDYKSFSRLILKPPSINTGQLTTVLFYWENTMSEHIKALEKAKIALMTKPDSVFFSEIAFSLKYVWDNTFPAAATNGTEMYLNTEFFLSLTPEERVGLILHEALHVAYMHICRCKERNHKLWNIAGDYVINQTLIDRDFKIPKCGLYDPQYKGMSTDQVYDLLKQEDQDHENFDGDIIPNDGISDEDLEDRTQQVILRAAIRSKQEGERIGAIPDDIQIFLDGLLKPKLPWNKLLLKYINQYSKSDYSFKRPNRRLFPAHYLPSLYNTTLMDIVVAVDTSGSVTDYEFKTFISEVASIFRMMKPNKITLIQFDTEISSVTEIKSFQELMKVNFKGRGGTDTEELMEWVVKNKPQLTMVFTDGCFRDNPVIPKTDVLWLIHNNQNFTAPYGKVLHYVV